MSHRLEDTKVATRYAKALFEGALESQLETQVSEDLEAIQVLLGQLPDLLPFLVNPAIPQSEKSTLIDGHVKGHVQDLVYQLVKLLLQNDRIGIFQTIIERYQVLFQDHSKLATAEMVTAVEMNEKLIQKFEQVLASRFGFRQVRIHNRVDPGILGGAIMKLQDKVIDGSFMGKLETLRQQLS